MRAADGDEEQNEQARAKSRAGDDVRQFARWIGAAARTVTGGGGSACAAAMVDTPAKTISHSAKLPPSASMAMPPTKLATMKVIDPHSRMRP